ncbi:MAG: hypothetical protein O7B99_07330 [Planctomycetota bacterium]|nr:hypothetical protein [Planctomycetota bacterium]
MIPPRDNMLEAFRDANRGEGGAVGGPFADGSRVGASPSSRRRTGMLLAAFVVAASSFAAGVLVGRSTAPVEGEVLAANDGKGAGSFLDVMEPKGSGSPAGAKGATGGEGPGQRVPSGATDPLFDPINKYTVVAITYGSSAWEDLALDNYDHLREQGLPVFPPLDPGDGKVVILVGAAPVHSELRDVQQKLQDLAGPDGRDHPYRGAYISPLRPLVGPARSQDD